MRRDHLNRIEINGLKEKIRYRNRKKNIQTRKKIYKKIKKIFIHWKNLHKRICNNDKVFQ